MTKSPKFNLTSALTRPVFVQARFRDGTEEERIAMHITVDPRLAKGSVYSHHKRQTEGFQPIHYSPKHIRHTGVPAEHANEMNEDADSVASAPDADQILFEISDRPIEEDIATAPETFVERPPTPIMIEDEPGVDAETQIGEFDLFNFDTEVRPLVRVIVQHTLLRALAEVHQEVELENIAKHKDRFEIERNTVLAELQRLEAKAQRLFEEKKRREDQRKAAKQEVRALNRKTSSAGFAEFYASDCMLIAMDLLEKDGFFIDEVEDEVSQSFLPWLSGEIENSLKVKEHLVGIREKSEAKTLEIAAKKKETFAQVKKERDNLEQVTEKSTLRNLLIEDRAGENIRRALNERDKKKALEEKAKHGKTEVREEDSYETDN